MSSEASRQREIREIAIAAHSGEATDAQLARLDELIRSNPQLAKYVAQVFDLQASLAWQGSMSDLHLSPVATFAEADDSSSAKAEAAYSTSRHRWLDGWAWPAIAVGIAFLLGTVASQLLSSRESKESVAQWDRSVDPPTVAEAEPVYEARLVRNTACLWDSNSVGSRENGSWLSSGESLHLLEGLAEIRLEWARGGNAMLSLEGPAAMMLTSEGMPTLRFGRMTATIDTSSRPFVLETPVGRLVVAEFGSIGVSAYGNDGEIHIFDGKATLEPAWLTWTNQHNLPLEIKAGEAVRVQEGRNGELNITRHPSDKEYFVAQLSMNSDALVIPPAYVSAVRESNPLAYWRFERGEWPKAINQMGSRFSGHVVGALGVAGYQGNQAVEFGVTDRGGEIICDETLGDEIKNSYSIEFWIKPSHYHVGSVISLVGDPDMPGAIVPHSFLLELGGTGLIPTAVHHPGRMRFLHRSPPSNESDLGTSCYSTDAYTLRKWQHVVAVKNDGRMQLYFNGAQAGEGSDPTDLPPGMRLLVGRLYPSRQVRPFIGQLDELAIYNRALTPAEIKKHFQLVRPKKASEPSI